MIQYEIREAVNKIIGHQLQDIGFKSNKSLKSYKHKDVSTISKLFVSVQKMNDVYSIHFRFSGFNNKASRLFKSVENEVRSRNDEPGYNVLRPTLEITDWGTVRNYYNYKGDLGWFEYVKDVEQVGELEDKIVNVKDLMLKIHSDTQDTMRLQKLLLLDGSEHHLKMYLCLSFISGGNMVEAFSLVKNIYVDYLEPIRNDIDQFFEVLKQIIVERSTQA